MNAASTYPTRPLTAALELPSHLELVVVHLHERVNDDQVGAPKYWTLLDRILAARTEEAPADPPLGPVEPLPLGLATDHPGADFLERIESDR